MPIYAIWMFFREWAAEIPPLSAVLAKEYISQSSDASDLGKLVDFVVAFALSEMDCVMLKHPIAPTFCL